MGFLSSTDRAEIQKMFDSLERDVKMVYFTERESLIVIPGRGCASCKDTQALLEEVAALSERLSLDVQEYTPDGDAAGESGIDKIPAIVIEAEGVQGRVRYFGMPSGYEFSVLAGAIVDAGSSSTGLAEETLDLLEGISEDTHIQIFVTPT